MPKQLSQFCSWQKGCVAAHQTNLVCFKQSLYWEKLVLEHCSMQKHVKEPFQCTASEDLNSNKYLRCALLAEWECLVPSEVLFLIFCQSVQFSITVLHDNCKDLCAFRKQHVTSPDNYLFHSASGKMFVQQFLPSKVFPVRIVILSLSVTIDYMIRY